MASLSHVHFPLGLRGARWQTIKRVDGCALLLNHSCASAPCRRCHVTCAAAAAPEAPARKPGKKKKKEDEEVPTPVPRAFQQTIRRSITVGGLGLHTAEYAYVRVRPAMAGEGRYFVRVPEGTNKHRFIMEDEMVEMTVEEAEAAEHALDRDEEARRVNMFLQFLKDEDEERFAGTFEEYVKQVSEEYVKQREVADWARQVKIDQDHGEDEEVQALDEDEPFCPATLEFVQVTNPYYLDLQRGECRVLGAELLLAALEGCGVDNARIEIEGGSEVPIIDGSALGWTQELERVGLKDALQARRERVKRHVWEPKAPQLVQGQNEAYAHFMPGPVQRVTAGLDASTEAPVIGQQWFTFTPVYDDATFYEEVSMARLYTLSRQRELEMRRQGFVKGGTHNVTITAAWDQWDDSQMVRFPDEEPARYRVLQMVGLLSLLGSEGNGGLPYGHVLTFQGDLPLMIQLLQHIQATCTSEHLVPYQMPVRISQPVEASAKDGGEDDADGEDDA